MSHYLEEQGGHVFWVVFACVPLITYICTCGPFFFFPLFIALLELSYDLHQTWVTQIGKFLHLHFIDGKIEILPILWLPDAKNWLVGKDPAAGKGWRQEEKGTTEDEMVGWRHQLDGWEFEQVPGVGEGQGSLACCSPWDRTESDMTERLNWADAIQLSIWKALIFS